MTTKPHDLILLKGPPGVGKSTTAKLLSRHFPQGVRLEVDTLRQMVISVDWKNQLEHRMVLALSAVLAAGFLRSGCCPVLLVDTFSGDKIDGFLADFRSECPGARVFVAVLHASDRTLCERIMNREVGAFKNVEIATQINHDAIVGVRPFESLIDTTDLSPPEVVTAIMKLVQHD